MQHVKEQLHRAHLVNTRKIHHVFSNHVGSVLRASAVRLRGGGFQTRFRKPPPVHQTGQGLHCCDALHLHQFTDRKRVQAPSRTTDRQRLTSLAKGVHPRTACDQHRLAFRAAVPSTFQEVFSITHFVNFVKGPQTRLWRPRAWADEFAVCGHVPIQVMRRHGADTAQNQSRPSNAEPDGLVSLARAVEHHQLAAKITENLRGRHAVNTRSERKTPQIDYLRISVLLPNIDSTKSTATSAVAFRTSSAGLSSITSRDAKRPVSAIISMHSWASR